MIWNRFNLKILARLWADGLNCTEIGAELGCSRGAVIGKASRMGLKRRKLEPVKEAPKPVEEIPMPRQVPFVMPNRPEFRGVGYLALRTNHCRWPIGGRDRDGLMLSCGVDRVEPSSYCAKHEARSVAVRIR